MTLAQVLAMPLFELGGKPVSLTSILILIPLAIGVFTLARVLSHWINLTLLTRLGLDRGTREAISTGVSYGLIALGLVIVLQSLGFNLSSLAVLAGVLGIGIGFGLQSLASNFISGITLLFERPIKVGDFIEVEKLLGTVEKISIRSTTIRTLDNVYVIVPNNYFIENQVVNWSYQDRKYRLHIPVGVAYESDPVAVTEALLAAARKESQVLSHPSPKVWLAGFGDSALKFELLVWIGDPPETFNVKSSLNFLIEQEFRKRHIEIPVPQMDMRIRNLRELGTMLHTHQEPESATTGLASEGISLDTLKLTTQSTHGWTLRVLLRRITYFEQCSDAELRILVEHGYREFYSKGQVICQENDPGESFYIILSGSVEVLSQRISKYIATLHTGEFFGEIALLTGTPRSATVRAMEDTILFVVDRGDLQKLLGQHRDLAEQIAHKLAERQQVLQDLGLLDEGMLQQMGETPFSWIRRRIQTIFGI
ncbi:hypothetical protein BST81_22945 [Leptolyngbya sp. 'hensonii']|nr:hypothetical protein BST81_22945 [Leptolyngbya sp. 'hensonii']